VALISNSHLTTRPKKDWSYSCTVPPGLHGLLWGEIYCTLKILLLLHTAILYSGIFCAGDETSILCLIYLSVSAHLQTILCVAAYWICSQLFSASACHSSFPLCRNCKGAFLLSSVMYSKYMWPFMAHYIHAKLFSRSSHNSAFLAYLRIYTAVSFAFVIVPLGGYMCDRIHSFNLVCFGVVPGGEVRKM
jgi:hypothetical protein